MKNNVKEVLAQVLAVSVKNILLFAFGMTLGFPTVLIPSLSDDSPMNNETLHVDKDYKETLSWVGSINLICVPLGCLVSGKIAHRFGRKRAMQIVNVPFFIAWMLFYFSGEIWHILLALCLTGLTGGLLEAPVITYIAEISEPRLRGILSSTSTMSVTCGVMAEFLLGIFLQWRDIALVNAFVPIFSVISLYFIPESPVWLMTKDRTDEARKSVAWLKGWRSVEETRNEFRVFQGQHLQVETTAIEEGGADGSKGTSAWLSRKFAWPFALVSLSFFLAHFNGNTAFMVYAIKVFSALNATKDRYFVTAVAGVVQLLGAVLSVAVINIFGKRKVNIVSMVATSSCFAIVGHYAFSNGCVDLNGCEDVGEAWIPTTFLVFSSFFSYAGIKILPWILVGEVFSNEVRATASGLSSAVGYVLSFVASKLFLDMVSVLTLPGVFWFDAAVGMLGAALIYFLLPETEGKTLGAIASHFAGGKSIGNDVGRVRNVQSVV